MKKVLNERVRKKKYLFKFFSEKKKEDLELQWDQIMALFSSWLNFFTQMWPKTDFLGYFETSRSGNAV